MSADTVSRGELPYAVADERERCALLCEELARMHELRAARVRGEGTYSTRSLWPLFRKTTLVRPAWESVAKTLEAAAHSLRTVAHGCREGWDPRRLKG